MTRLMCPAGLPWLPIELMVGKKIGKPGAQVSPAVFRKACREYAGKQVTYKKKHLSGWGFLGDWDNPYLTMDFAFEADIVRSLGKITQKGHITTGAKPVHWCTIAVRHWQKPRLNMKINIRQR